MFLDIETIPAESEKKEILLDLYKRKLEKSNGGKNPPPTFEEYVESTGLDGAFGRICCIGVAVDDQPAQCLFGTEKEMLAKFWGVAREVDLFIGFNVMDFDLKFIYQRSVILGVKPTQELNFARYRNSPIYDVMYEWTKWSNLNKISLHALAKALGIKSSKEGGIEGKHIASAYAQGKIKEICEYCARDVEVTREVYKKLRFEK